MSEVTLKINNRGYSLACDEGQEQRLVDLSHYVDSRLRDISMAGAATNEAHLLVLTSLVLTDEIYELRDEVASLREQARCLQASSSEGTQLNIEHVVNDEEMIAQAIDHLAGKIEHIAERIGKA